MKLMSPNFVRNIFRNYFTIAPTLQILNYTVWQCRRFDVSAVRLNIHLTLIHDHNYHAFFLFVTSCNTRFGLHVVFTRLKHGVLQCNSTLRTFPILFHWLSFIFHQIYEFYRIGLKRDDINSFSPFGCKFVCLFFFLFSLSCRKKNDWRIYFKLLLLGHLVLASYLWNSELFFGIDDNRSWTRLYFLRLNFLI